MTSGMTDRTTAATDPDGPAPEATEQAHHAALTADEHGGIDLRVLDQQVRAAFDLPASTPVRRELLGGGLSQTTIRYRFEPGGPHASVIVRIPPVHGPLAPYSPEGEAALLRWLTGHGIAVPRVLSSGPAGGPLGRAFLISEEISGDVVRDGARGYTDQDKTLLAHAYTAALAGFHGLAGAERSAEVLDWAPRKDPAGVLDRWTRSLAETGLVLPDFHRFLTDWLGDRMPATGTTTVVHGDFRLGNVLWRRPGEISAILDWEEAGAGDPYFDLGWTLMGTDAPEDSMMGVLSRREFLARYEDLAGTEVDRERLLWWEIAAGWSRLCMEAKAIALIDEGHYLDLRPLLSTYLNRRLSIVLLEKIQRHEGTRTGSEHL
ncbi:phosphotransferase family protein [Nocardia brevicatena]|uniref:phosphotransferase family protein n=1 Tax=Nocardia brevicatena TaxID=37327 RepID=UPI0002D36B47|nr:phosphotransferase family protein [Nocardia brevicatena]